MTLLRGGVTRCRIWTEVRPVMGRGRARRARRDLRRVGRVSTGALRGENGLRVDFPVRWREPGEERETHSEPIFALTGREDEVRT